MHRRSYDWSIYDDEQLPIMERYWDECVRLYLSLMPRRLARRRAAWSGINLGTFNGAYQKAWMRLGFKMYGIEFRDVIDELRAYGCSGERGNFFSLPTLADKLFDFVVMDRALFHKPHQAFRENSETGKLEERTVEHRVRGAPPFFAEALRILKADGVLFAVLYEHWSEHALRELYQEGHVDLVQVRRRSKPYLCAILDRARPAQPFPTVVDAVRLLSGGTPADALRRARNSAVVGKAVQWGPGRVKIHHLPTNRAVTFEPGTGTMLSDELVLNDPDAERFFLSGRGSLRRLGAGGPGARPVILLLDRTLIGDGKNMAAMARTCGPVYYHSGMVRGSRTLKSSVHEVREEHAAGGLPSPAHVFIGVGDYDTLISRRSAKPSTSLALGKQALENAITTLHAVDAEVTVLLPGAIHVADTEPGLAAQTAAIDAYRAMAEEVSARLGATVLDWCAVHLVRDVGHFESLLARKEDDANLAAAIRNELEKHRAPPRESA
jgi:hypothetical protein